MFDVIGRTAKDRILAPVVTATPRWITPTAITVTSLVPGLAAAWAASRGAWTLALVLFMVNRILDGLDGLIARERKETSDFGGYLDILIDFLVYAAIPIGASIGAMEYGGAGSGAEGSFLVGSGFVIGVEGARWWSLVALLSVFYVNAASWMYLSAVIEKRRVGPSAAMPTATTPTTIVMPSGVVEGTETIIFYLLFLLLPQHLSLLFLAMALLTTIGIGGRVAWAWRHLRG